jgi:hypothetical protein
MAFYLDIRLPIGFRVKAEYKDQFYGTFKTLLGFVLQDLEERTNKNYTYFLKERLSEKEKKVLIGLLRGVQEEHQLSLVLEDHKEEILIDLEPLKRRYTR